MSTDLSRRGFFAAAGAAAALACTRTTHVVTAASPAVSPARGTTILFQGDSITDAGRERATPGTATDPDALNREANMSRWLGTGYPVLLAAALLDAHPDRGLRCFNRGVSGNTVPDLAARWDTDTVALAPEVLSILIGVNDYWHTLGAGATYHGTVADYESGYLALLHDTRTRLPKTRFVVLEPFVLPTGHVDASWFPEFDNRRAVAKRVAAQAGATFVPLQAAFNKAAARTGPAYWLGDGVHPTLAGHALIAQHWRGEVGL
jgi:lysophospholipase L1-like esterase